MHILECSIYPYSPGTVLEINREEIKKQCQYLTIGTKFKKKSLVSGHTCRWLQNWCGCSVFFHVNVETL